MASPRDEALKHGVDRSKLSGDDGYDAEAGTPAGQAARANMPSELANPVNPAEKPAPAKGLSRRKG